MKKFLISLSILCMLVLNASYATNNTEALLQYNRGIDYFKLGQYDKAISCFRLSISADPNYIDAYYNLGSVLEYLKQYDAALTVFKQIIVRKPEDYESVYKAAWLSYTLGDKERAKTYLAIIPEYSSYYNDAKNLASEMNFSLPDKKAKEVVQKPTTNISQNNQLYTNITAPTGITSDSKGNVYVAEYTLNSIIKLAPDNKKVLYIKNPKINGPIGIAMDSFNNMYIANYNGNNILKVSSRGEVSVLISNVKNPYMLYIKDGILFASCQGTNSVIKYKL